MKKEAVVVLLGVGLLFLFAAVRGVAALTVMQDTLAGQAAAGITGEAVADVTVAAITDVTGNSIVDVTGKATSGTVALSIEVAAGPSLAIKKPKNETYHSNESLEIRIETDATNAWYTLDHGANVTLEENDGETKSRDIEKEFNASGAGSHTLIVFANGSGGVAIKNVTFTVNPAAFNLSYGKYHNGKRGNSTNFNEFSLSELQNLTNITLEHTDFGRIAFPGIINLTDCGNSAGLACDLDAYINISSNWVEINTTGLPNFNISAIITLYNLSFTTPRIMADGAVCPSAVCTQLNYTGGSLLVNVTHFTAYYAEETPEDDDGDGPGGGDTSGGSGGGGGGGSGGGGVSIARILSLPAAGFSVSAGTLSADLKQGQVSSERFIVRNTGETDLDFTVSSTLRNLVRVGAPSFFLKPGEQQLVTIDFIAPDTLTPQLYLGKLLIKAGGITKEIPVSIAVASHKTLFDVKVLIPQRFLRVLAGDELVAEVTLFSVGRRGAVDVDVNYLIKDPSGTVVFDEQEVVSVETRTSYLKNLYIPYGLSPGQYFFYITAAFVGQKGISIATFQVVGPEAFTASSSYIPTITLGALLFILLFLVAHHFMQRSHHRKHHPPREKRHSAPWETEDDGTIPVSSIFRRS